MLQTMMSFIQLILMFFRTHTRVNFMLKDQRKVCLDRVGLRGRDLDIAAGQFEEALQPKTKISAFHLRSGFR